MYLYQPSINPVTRSNGSFSNSDGQHFSDLLPQDFWTAENSNEAFRVAWALEEVQASRKTHFPQSLLYAPGVGGEEAVETTNNDWLWSKNGEGGNTWQTEKKRVEGVSELVLWENIS